MNVWSSQALKGRGALDCLAGILQHRRQLEQENRFRDTVFGRKGCDIPARDFSGKTPCINRRVRVFMPLAGFSAVCATVINVTGRRHGIDRPTMIKICRPCGKTIFTKADRQTISAYRAFTRMSELGAAVRWEFMRTVTAPEACGEGRWSSPAVPAGEHADKFPAFSS
ncbi:MAG: hypothetical protein M0C28_09085 [Candidatus Moduliflexus flocculans]|nr:hypothetical protein [Candidatus Moduliflexus flocculans]